MKISPGATEREYILQFDSLQEFEDFFARLEKDGHSLLEKSAIPRDSILIARAHGSTRSRRFNSDQIPQPQATAKPSAEPESSQASNEITEVVKEQKPRNLAEKIRAMPVTERVTLAIKADLHERRILAQQNNIKIHEFLLRNPRITEAEIAWMARNATSPIQTILTIAQHKGWMRIESIRMGILMNPKTPATMAMDMIPLLSAGDLIKMFHSRLLREDVHAAVEREAKKRGIRIPRTDREI